MLFYQYYDKEFVQIRLVAGHRNEFKYNGPQTALLGLELETTQCRDHVS